MESSSFKNLEDLSLVTLIAVRDCFRMQHLYRQRARETDPEEIAKIDREMVDFLLSMDKLVESDGKMIRPLEEMHPKLTPEEIGTLRFRKAISAETRVKLRIYCADFTRETLGA